MSRPPTRPAGSPRNLRHHRGVQREKKTVLMTTHYIEEAERLCDRVAIVDYGRVIAPGTPRELKHSSAGTTRIEVRLARPLTNGVLTTLEGVADSRDFDGTYVIHSTLPPRTIVALVKQLEAENNELQSLEMFSPSLEDVFIELTGRRLRDLVENGLERLREYLDSHESTRPAWPCAIVPSYFFSLFMPLGLPLLFLVMVFSKGDSPWTAYILGSILTMTVMGSFWGLSVQLVTFREAGDPPPLPPRAVGRRPHACVQHSGELHPGHSPPLSIEISSHQVVPAHAIVGESGGDVSAGYPLVRRRFPRSA